MWLFLTFLILPSTAEVTVGYLDQLTTLLRYRHFIDNESPQEWVRLLGPDVLALTHPQVTAGITNQFIAFNKAREANVSPNCQTLLRTAAWVHDWGELIIDGQGVGDIQFDFKKDSHETEEADIFGLVLKGLSESPEKELLRKAYMEVVVDKHSNPGTMFNAIERIGYLQTAIRAFRGIDGDHIKTGWVLQQMFLVTK